MASACPTAPAEFSNVMFSAVKSSASIVVEGVLERADGLAVGGDAGVQDYT
jgi:hypothetical protein